MSDTNLRSQLPAAPARRNFFRMISATAVSAAVANAVRPAMAASTDKTNELIYMSATKLAQLIRAKQVSALEAVNAYIDRQIAVDDMLNAVVMNSYARARAEAKALDAKAAKGEFVGPLHGVPMTIKDSLDTEGVITTGATYGRQQYIPPRDATRRGSCPPGRRHPVGKDEHARVHSRWTGRHQHRQQPVVWLIA